MTRPALWLPLGFIYIQGLSLANPIYWLLVSLFLHALPRVRIDGISFACLGLLVAAQCAALLLTPHPLPASLAPTVLGLFLLTLRPESFGQGLWGAPERRLALNLIYVVAVVYAIDALPRLPHLWLNFADWTDYEFREALKKDTRLADDTNTTAIRLVFLYFAVTVFERVPLRRVVADLTFGLLFLSTFSRAGLYLFALLLFNRGGWMPRWAAKHRAMLALVAAIVGIFYGDQLVQLDLAGADSSVLAKYDLVLGSFRHWIEADALTRLIGTGYFSNTDVGTLLSATGHSIIYYALVELGVLGSVLLGVIVWRAAGNRDGKFLVVCTCILGLSVFRFDFVFLFAALLIISLHRAPDPDGAAERPPASPAAGGRPRAS